MSVVHEWQQVQSKAISALQYSAEINIFGNYGCEHKVGLLSVKYIIISNY